MSEIKKGKLYQKMAEIDKQFNDRMDDLSFKDLEPVLDEAKALLDECHSLEDYENWKRVWFGSVPLSVIFTFTDPVF